MEKGTFHKEDQPSATLFAGIDYGSKSAGTTVIAYPVEGIIRFASSAGHRDADRFILDWCTQHPCRIIYLDAPLSLPGVYRYPERYSDYFYRAADRAVSAMSPMFLGGLTARAIQLRNELEKSGVTTTEVYPARLAMELGLEKDKYKKSKQHLAAFAERLSTQLPFEIDRTAIVNWHHFDALLAFLSGWRHQQNEHLSFGDETEGQIIV